jgi:hypothetical protein
MLQSHLLTNPNDVHVQTGEKLLGSYELINQHLDLLQPFLMKITTMG